jgi:peptidoglycan/LPS O-acetylase OafA/YrhL
MQLVLESKYTKHRLGKSWRSQFYKARYFRLLPIYLAGSSLAIAVALLSPRSSDFVTAWHNAWRLPNTVENIFFKSFLCFTNFTIFFQDSTMFLAVHDGLIHWSGNYTNSEMPLWQGARSSPGMISWN